MQKPSSDTMFNDGDVVAVLKQEETSLGLIYHIYSDGIASVRFVTPNGEDRLEYVAFNEMFHVTEENIKKMICHQQWKADYHTKQLNFAAKAYEVFLARFHNKLEKGEAASDVGKYRMEITGK